MVAKRKNKYFLSKLKSKKLDLTPEAVLDLHGFTKEEAKEELSLFLINARTRHLKKVKIITGQGWHNKDFQSVLKPFVEAILDAENCSYTEATISEGGRGALIVDL